MTLALPYPNLDFVPLDVLTAEQMNQMVANTNFIAQQFPIQNANVDWTSVKPTRILPSDFCTASTGFTVSTSSTHIRQIGKIVFGDMLVSSTNAIPTGQQTTICTLKPAYTPWADSAGDNNAINTWGATAYSEWGTPHPTYLYIGASVIVNPGTANDKWVKFSFCYCIA